MKNKNKDVIIFSQVYEQAFTWGEEVYNLRQTIKKVRLFVKSKIDRQSAEC